MKFFYSDALFNWSPIILALCVQEAKQNEKRLPEITEVIDSHYRYKSYFVWLPTRNVSHFHVAKEKALNLRYIPKQTVIIYFEHWVCSIFHIIFTARATMLFFSMYCVRISTERPDVLDEKRPVIVSVVFLHFALFALFWNSVLNSKRNSRWNCIVLCIFFYLFIRHIHKIA